jgi:predicted amidohydrolase
MICADGRMPEIGRSLARRGAWLVLDPTAWVAFGSSYERMHNPQADFMMSVRARENGIWIAAADKYGSEHASVHYVGRSMIVAPDGDVASVGPANGPALVIADAVHARARPFVAALTASERRALQRLRPRKRSRAGAFRLAVLQGPMRTGRSSALRALEAQVVAAIIETPASPSAVRQALRRLRGVGIAVTSGRRMLAPEPARAAALLGIDLVVWTSPPRLAFARDIARTRAVENRVFVVVCATAAHSSPACVIDPSGNVIGEALEGIPSGFVAAIDPRAARDKTLVPCTDAFDARIPQASGDFESRSRR